MSLVAKNRLKRTLLLKWGVAKHDGLCFLCSFIMVMGQPLRKQKLVLPLRKKVPFYWMSEVAKQSLYPGALGKIFQLC